MIPVRAATAADAGWIGAILDKKWGGPIIWADGRAFDCRAPPALVAEPRGLRHLRGCRRRAELMLLEAIGRCRGIGTALVAALSALLAGQGVRELWLTTTNDNLDALRFYQRRGFRLAEVRVGAMEEYRRQTVCSGGRQFGIPIRDELRLVRPIRPNLTAPIDANRLQRVLPATRFS